jgi:hypothetical protein
MWMSAGAVTDIGDEVFLSVNSDMERIPTGFFMPDGIFVPADTYHNWNSSLHFGASAARWIAGNFNIDYGGIYGGDFFGLSGNIDLRPSPCRTDRSGFTFRPWRRTSTSRRT